MVTTYFKQCLTEEIEKLQKRAPKLVSACEHVKNYQMNKGIYVIYVKLPTLKYRRHMGDMIKTYKLLNNLYDETVVPGLMQSSVISTRGHDFKLYKSD